MEPVSLPLVTRRMGWTAVLRSRGGDECHSRRIGQGFSDSACGLAAASIGSTGKAQAILVAG